jgi:peroxiredoxin
MNGKTAWLGSMVALLLVGGLAKADNANMIGERRAQAAGRDLIGSPAPALLLKTIDGKTIDLSSLYGKKAVYLKFWATWCVPCRQQMPHFQHVFESEGSDLAVIAVNVGFNDSIEEIRKYQERLGITMPVVFDDDGHLGGAFNVRVTPQHIIIGRDGRIQYIGHLADARLDSALVTARAPLAQNRAVERVASTDTGHIQRFAVGDQVPNTVVRTLDGRSFQFAKQGFKGPTVLVFMSPWCESYLATTRPAVATNCRIAREEVAALSRHPQARWLGVASGLWAAPKDLKEYRDGYKVTLPLTLDESGALFRQFGVSETPTIIILDANRNIVRRITSGEVATLKQVIPAP